MAAEPVCPRWEFQLPLAPDELLRSAVPTQYAVREVLSPAQLPAQLAAFQAAFRAQGALAVLQHFDTLYSVLHHFRILDAAAREDALELVMKGGYGLLSPLIGRVCLHVLLAAV
uniref:Uncharacterized protein n=1 Tax=Sphenodon punctatus TaxID=8508 RepID=A0A8D0HHD7_SPHPU